VWSTKRLFVSLAVVALVLAGLAMQRGVALVDAAPSPPFTQCPAVGADPSCKLLIYIDNTGAVVLNNTALGPYDGIEDTLIGVQNDSGITITGFDISGSNIFGLDGDGLCNVSPRPSGCPFGPTGYEGPGTSFTIANASNGAVHFTGGLGTGNSAYFSLEEPLTGQDICIPQGKLTYTGATADQYNDPFSASATLTNSCTHAAISGGSVSFKLDGDGSCTATTNASGQASCPVTPGVAAGSSTLTISYAGLSGSILASSITSPLTVTLEDAALTYTGATGGHYNDPFKASAQLVDPADPTENESSDTPVAGKTVSFTLNGTDTCSATTDATGVAACNITPTEAAGTYTLAVSFAGDGYYQPAKASPSFTVTLEDSAITSTTSLQVIAQGGKATLAATLTEPADPTEGETVATSIAGYPVTLTLGSGAGSQSCTATTDATGVATCTISPVTVGVGYQTVTDSFVDKTGHYQPATNTQKALVFAFAPGGGAFVIGDVSNKPNAAVTFWGAQWSMLNVLSGGAAPSAFKGYALNPAIPSCGASWSTDPGNSAPPPSGPLPAYMGVIVSSSTTQSGSQISGNTAHIVVVQTDTGYDPNAGHAGTGTVVATFC
jgi:hypothetical protein